MRTSSASETAIADAIADVTVAARDVMVERLELAIVRVNDDVRRLAGVFALGGLAIVATAIAASMLAVALGTVLGARIGIAAAATLVGLTGVVAAVALARVARARLSRPPSTVALALPAAGSERHG